MKCHFAAYILHPEAFVQDYLQLVDIISYIDQNKNTLRVIITPETEDLLSCLSSAHLYLGHDSGITHLAAMLGVPTIALFKTSDLQQWKPLGPRVMVFEDRVQYGGLKDKVLSEAERIMLEDAVDYGTGC